MAALPALDRGAQPYLIIERLNQLVSEYNQERTLIAVSVLPNVNLYAGFRRIVKDATATTFGSIVAGGGANIVPVYSDGTNWRIG